MSDVEGFASVLAQTGHHLGQVERVRGPVVDQADGVRDALEASTDQPRHLSGLPHHRDGLEELVVDQDAGLLPDQSGKELQGIQVCYARSVVN